MMVQINEVNRPCITQPIETAFIQSDLGSLCEKISELQAINMALPFHKNVLQVFILFSAYHHGKAVVP